jgi:hypothetical protein
MIAMIHETTPFPGWKKNEDGPRRKWGSRYADRRSCHHAPSTTAKYPSPAISDCTVNTGHRQCERRAEGQAGARTGAGTRRRAPRQGRHHAQPGRARSTATQHVTLGAHLHPSGETENAKAHQRSQVVIERRRVPRLHCPCLGITRPRNDLQVILTYPPLNPFPIVSCVCSVRFTPLSTQGPGRRFGSEYLTARAMTAAHRCPCSRVLPGVALVYCWAWWALPSL